MICFVILQSFDEMSKLFFCRGVLIFARKYCKKQYDFFYQTGKLADLSCFFLTFFYKDVIFLKQKS